MKKLIPFLLVTHFGLSACKDSDSTNSAASTPSNNWVTYRLQSANVNIGDEYGGTSPSAFVFHYGTDVEFQFKYLTSGEITQVEIFQGVKLLSLNAYTNVSADNWHIDNLLFLKALPESEKPLAWTFNEDWDNYNSRYMWGSISEPWGGSPGNEAPRLQQDMKNNLASPANATDSSPPTTIFKRQFTAIQQLKHWESWVDGKLVDVAELTYYPNGLLQSIQRQSLATIFTPPEPAQVGTGIPAINATAERLELTLSESYSYPLLTSDKLQMRIDSKDLVTSTHRVFIANYERADCGPMLSERSKNMLPVPMPFCVKYKK